jgi:hypothetical protein
MQTLTGEFATLQIAEVSSSGEAGKATWKVQMKYKSQNMIEIWTNNLF